jgi:hypothetical protein
MNLQFFASGFLRLHGIKVVIEPEMAQRNASDRLRAPAERDVPMNFHRDCRKPLKGKNKLASFCPSGASSRALKRLFCQDLSVFEIT